MTKIRSGFWRCYWIATPQTLPVFTHSPVCILHKFFLPLRIFGTFFVVRSTLNIKEKGKIYHKKLNIEATELLSRTDLNSVYCAPSLCFVCLNFHFKLWGLQTDFAVCLPSRAHNCHCHTCSHWFFTFCSGIVLTIMSIPCECVLQFLFLLKTWSCLSLQMRRYCWCNSDMSTGSCKDTPAVLLCDSLHLWSSSQHSQWCYCQPGSQSFSWTSPLSEVSVPGTRVWLHFGKGQNQNLYKTFRLYICHDATRR